MNYSKLHPFRRYLLWGFFCFLLGSVFILALPEKSKPIVSTLARDQVLFLQDESLYKNPLLSEATSPPSKVRKEFEKGWKQFESGKIQKARSAFSKIASANRRFIFPQVARAFCDFKEGRVEVGRAQLERLQTLAPSHLSILNFLSRFYAKWGENEKALITWRTLVTFVPPDEEERARFHTFRLRVLDEWIQRAREARARSQWAQAEAFYLKVSEEAPELVIAVRELGEVYSAMGRNQDALGLLKRVAEAEPTNEDVKKKMVELHLRLKQHEEAQKLIEEMQSAGPDDADLQTIREAIAARETLEEKALRRIHQSAALTRGDWGGLLSTRFPFLADMAPRPLEILTDIQNHWAKSYLPAIASLQLIESFPNHQFKPDLPVKRAEVSQTIRQLVLLLAGTRKDQLKADSKLEIMDVPRSHAHWPAIQFVVAMKWMHLTPAGAFKPNETIAGREADSILLEVSSFLQQFFRKEATND